MSMPMPLHKTKDQINEPKVCFKGLGELKGKCYIKLDPRVKPVQRHPRRVPQAHHGDIG